MKKTQERWTKPQTLEPKPKTPTFVKLDTENAKHKKDERAEAADSSEPLGALEKQHHQGAELRKFLFLFFYYYSSFFVTVASPFMLEQQHLQRTEL